MSITRLLVCICFVYAEAPVLALLAAGQCADCHEDRKSMSVSGLGCSVQVSQRGVRGASLLVTHKPVLLMRGSVHS